MSETKKNKPVLLIALGILGAFVFFSVLGTYAFYFHDHEVIENPAAWGVFGDYLAGTVGPLIAFLAFVGLLWTIHLNHEELRYTRDELTTSRRALEQSNTISKGRAARERIEDQKSDIYRIIEPLTKDIEAILDRGMINPGTVQLAEGRQIRFSGEYVLRDLFRESDFNNPTVRHILAKNNDTALRELARKLEALEEYLRAYERLAGDEFFTGYYKPLYEPWVTLLSEREKLRKERRQDVLDFFQRGVGVLTSADSSIGGIEGSITFGFEVEGKTKHRTRVEEDTVNVIEAEPNEPRELPYVFVHTYPMPNDQNVRLAVVTWAYASPPSGGIPPTSLAVEKQEMSHEDAMQRGMEIAETYEFPTLYWQKDEPIDRGL